MQSDFRLKGLSAPKSATLNLIDTDREIFWAPFIMPDDRYLALFKWAKSDDEFWKTAWIATVEHDGLYDDKTPIDPKVIDVREWDLNFKPFN